MQIKSIQVVDRRFKMGEGAGSDATHTNPQYSYAVCVLKTDSSTDGIGLAFTLGDGNDLVCKAIEYLSENLKGQDIEELMSDFGVTYKAMADHPGLRWIGPHKGVIQLALAAVVNACYDLWAKSRQVPLWKLLLDLTPEQLVNTLDLSYLEEELTRDQAIAMLTEQYKTRDSRSGVLKTGYKGYDTSVGWFNFSDELVVEKTKRAIEKGFTALKLKVGSADPDRDLRRANLIRGVAGDAATIMLDANQKWTVPQALDICKKLGNINPFWIEEPTHPDDVFGHQTIARAIDYKVATGEHIPNKIIFKNFLQAKAMDFCQVDADKFTVQKIRSSRNASRG
jgi:L-fuconate dehydratase